MLPQLTFVALAWTWLAAAAPVTSQQRPAQPPTPPPGPTPTSLPAPNLTGSWSIRRVWYRSCPTCGQTVVRETPWQIVQVGNDIWVDRGLRGRIEGPYLDLGGVESDATGRLDFIYGTLRVTVDGFYFGGEFAGSETIQNPCPSGPFVVTCLVSSGWIEGRRVSGPTPTAPATLDLPTPFPVGTSTITPSPLPTLTETRAPPTVTDTPPAPTPAPWRSILLPWVVRYK